MHFRKLYVIGNGFDLWHEVPSEYKHFRDYVRNVDYELYEAIETYIPADAKWNDLEAALAEPDIDGIIDDLGHFMPSYGAEDWSDAGHHDFQFEVDRLVERLSYQLLVRFAEWVRAIPIPTPEMATKRLTTIDPAATFLTFNYTSTLSDLYAVPDAHVLHIHGRASQQDDDLILGHAWNPVQRKSLNERPDIEEIDTRLMEANTILDVYFSKTFKPSDRLIRDNQAYFNGLRAIDTVHVLGHSLSDVDRAYIEALLKEPSVAAAKWHIACREEKDRPEKHGRLVALGVNPQLITTALWTDY